MNNRESCAEHGTLAMRECADCLSETTAELRRARTRIAALTEALATERAAREAERIQANRDMASQVERDRVALEQAERERDEHAKHRANLDRKNQELSRENKRLVDYASGCQRERDAALARAKELEAARTAWINSSDRHFARAEENERKWLSAEQDRLQALAEFKREQQERLAQTDRYRACYDAKVAAESALASALARVKSLEDACDEFDARYDKGIEKYRQRALAAESALASARKLAVQLVQSIEDNYRSDECEDGDDDQVDGVIDADLILEDIRAIRDALASAPSPAQERTFEHPGAEEVFNSLRAARAPSPAPAEPEP